MAQKQVYYDDAAVFSDDNDVNVLKVHELLDKKYNIRFNPVFNENIAIAENDPQNERNAIIKPRYNELQLDILEDCYNNDWTCSICIQKTANYCMGKEGKTTLETRLEFNTEKEKVEELEFINKSKRYVVTKMDIDLLNKELRLHDMLIDAIKSALAYGRAAIQIGKLDKDGRPTSLKLLTSRRLGRVKVEKETKKIISVEYLDIVEAGDPNTPESDDTKRFIPIDDLIYIVNSEGSVAINSEFTGVAKLEALVNISQVKRIIMNQNLKEAAKTNYAGVLIAQFPPDTDDATITRWIANAAKSAGRWFAHRMNINVQHHKAETDLSKYDSLVELIDRAIIRRIGIPSTHAGYEQISNYANSEQVNVVYKSGEIITYRNWIKSVVNLAYLHPLFQRLAVSPYIKKKTEDYIERLAKREQYKKQLEPEPAEPEEDGPPPPDSKPPQTPDKIKPPVEPQEPDQQEGDAQATQTLIDTEDLIPVDTVTLAYSFFDISFLTQKETVEQLKILDSMFPLPVEMVLKAAGYEGFIAEVQAYKQSREEKAAEISGQTLEQVQAGMMAPSNMPAQFIPKNPNVVKGAIQSKTNNDNSNTNVAAAEDAFKPFLDEEIKNNALLTAKKIKLYNLLEDKINSLR